MPPRNNHKPDQEAKYAMADACLCERPPCSYLRYVVWIAVALLGFAVATIIPTGYTRYQDMRQVQSTNLRRLDQAELRIEALEKATESTAKTMDGLRQDVARLSGKTEAVLETVQATLQEVREQRKRSEIHANREVTP